MPESYISLTGVLLGLHLAHRESAAGQLGPVVGRGLAGNAVATAWLAWTALRMYCRAILFGMDHSETEWPIMDPEAPRIVNA